MVLMKLRTLTVALLSLASLIFAIPTRLNTTTTTGLTKLNMAVAAATTNLTTRSLFHGPCICLYAPRAYPGNVWDLLVANGTRYSTGPDDCGLAHLESLRGRCGIITDWTCYYPPAGNGTMILEDSVRLKFKTSIWCTLYDVTQALLFSTDDEQQIDCQGTCY